MKMMVLMPSQNSRGAVAHSQNRGAVAAGFDAISLKRKETSFYRIARFRHLPGRIHHPKRAARLGTPVRSSVPR